MAFGSDKFKEKMGEEKLLVLINSLTDVKETSEIAEDKLKLYLSAFVIARDIGDEHEYHTLTGFTWGESLQFILDIIDHL
jgi:hypothetical protein